MNTLYKSQIACQVGVIADDLTGANDAGVQFRRANLSTTVILNESMLTDVMVATDVVVVNTNSRHIKSEEAYERSKRAAHFFGKYKVKYIYKKIDSTLRGNAGAEINGIMDALNLNVCLLAPSFPINERTTLNGRQFLHGAPLEVTELSSDILTPSYSSYIPEVIARQSCRKVGLIKLDVVRQGAKAISERIHNLVGMGYSILVIDAVVQRDLSAIAQAVSHLKIPNMASGSAGLAAELPSAFGISRSVSKTSIPLLKKGVLALVGSATQISALQVLGAAEDSRICILLLDPYLVREKYVCTHHIDELAEKSYRHLTSGSDVLISVERKNITGEIREQSQKIKNAFAEIVTSVVARETVRGIMVTGGDTAQAIFRALGVSGISLECEVLPGMPFGYLLGGIAHAMPVITKAGSFGKKDTLITAIKYLRSH